MNSWHVIGSKIFLFIYLFIYLTLLKTFNRFTNRHLDNKHGQEWQGHHNSVNQLLWTLYTIIHTIIITHSHTVHGQETIKNNKLAWNVSGD